MLGSKKKTEHEIQNEILVYVTQLPNTFAFRMNTGATKVGDRFVSFGLKGQPDIFAIISGRFVGIEVKAAKGRQSEAQKNWEENCTQAGGLYVLARSVEDVQNFLKAAQLVLL